MGTLRSVAAAMPERGRHPVSQGRPVALVRGSRSQSRVEKHAQGAQGPLQRSSVGQRLSSNAERRLQATGQQKGPQLAAQEKRGAAGLAKNPIGQRGTKTCCQTT